MLSYLYKFVLICAASSAFLFAADPSPVQNAASSSTQSLNSGPSLQSLTKHSGYIFEGVVTRVAMNAGKGPNDGGTMSVTFRVTQGLRGVRDGEIFTIHEWSGLWNGVTRYKSGEHVVLFLYPQSTLGLTSPVAGTLGKFSADASGKIVISQAQSTLLHDANLQLSADGKLRITAQRFFQIVREQAEQ